MPIDWEPLREIIEANERFVLSSHIRPDADALGSELGLAGILEAMGKSVRIVNPSHAPAHLAFLDPEHRIRKIREEVPEAEVLDTDVHVILDTSSWSQLNAVGRVLKQTKAAKVVIDHHVSSDDLGAIEFKDMNAEATGALVVRMAEALGVPLPPETATPLYCAVATDTGWFRFAATSGDTMRTAGRLIDLGAEPHRLYTLLYDQYSLARILLASRALSRVTLDCDGKLAYTWVELADFKKTGAYPAETEDLVNECLKIGGTRCAFIAIEQQNKTVKVSFRSRTGLNVARIAEQFGGGGHKQAAGATLPGPLTNAMSTVLTSLKTALRE